MKLVIPGTLPTMNERKGRFTPEELEYIKSNYKRTNLREIAKYLGREKNYQNVCRTARRLGLTDNSGEKVEHPTPRDLRREAKYPDEKSRKEAIGQSTKERHAKNGHPRGMKGKTHSGDVREQQRQRLIEQWKDSNSPFNSPQFRQQRSNKMSVIMANRLKNDPESIKTRGSGGKREDIGIYVRSSWEANYARYLNWLKDKKEIHDWEYEPDTYWFEHIKRGSRSYTPDFKVWKTQTSYEYHEVKGYMDTKSQTKLKRMARYYPNERVLVIAKEEYAALKKWARLIPGWE